MDDVARNPVLIWVTQGLDQLVRSEARLTAAKALAGGERQMTFNGG